MNHDPDYSAAYVIVRTNSNDGHEGHGFVFTIGRGNNVQAAAIQALAPHVVGLPVEEVLADMGRFSRFLVHDSQLRWLGPEKGVMHMAIGAVVNAMWDLKAKRAAMPVWRLLSEMAPEELVALIDFRYLSDALTPHEALTILRHAAPGRDERITQLFASGVPAYSTTPGWLGYDDNKLARLCKEAISGGYRQIKLKVGENLEDDIRRLRIARDVCGPDMGIGIDANQRWDVATAIDWIRALTPFDLMWVEEPTSPDDVLGHAAIARAVAPVKIATGEHTQNRIMFKQLLQSEAISVLQLDATRVGGVNEHVAIILLAAKFGVPVSPHAGGVGLCELVQHLAMFDFVAVSGDKSDRVIEHVDHLHEHFVDPVRMHNGCYMPPEEPGFATMRPESLRDHSYPDGAEWAGVSPLPTRWPPAGRSQSAVAFNG